jgi:hypothetical protein
MRLRFLSFVLLLTLFALPALAQVAPTAAPPTAGEAFFAQAGPVLVDLVMAGALGLMTLLAGFLRARSAESRAAKVGSVITEAARAAVLELDATLKPKLKEYLADGKLSDAEKAELKQAAVDLLKTKLPIGLLDTAGKVFGAFTETLIAGKIEQAVAEKNALEGPAVSPPPA